MTKPDDPLAGVEVLEWQCTNCGYHPDSQDPTEEGGKCIKCNNGLYTIPLVAEPAVRKAMVEFIRKPICRDACVHIACGTLKERADRLERGSERGGER